MTTESAAHPVWLVNQETYPPVSRVWENPGRRDLMPIHIAVDQRLLTTYGRKL